MLKYIILVPFYLLQKLLYVLLLILTNIIIKYAEVNCIVFADKYRNITDKITFYTSLLTLMSSYRTQIRGYTFFQQEITATTSKILTTNQSLFYLRNLHNTI